MEKTVEERAKIYEPDAFDVDEIIPAREGHIVNLIRLAYIHGATEQKAIDIDKAIEWIKWNNDNGGCLFDGWENDFRKTMEE